jgi:hypothetical protein
MTFSNSKFKLLQELDDFSFTLSSSDRIWDIVCPTDTNCWDHLRVSRYRDTYYITHINGDSGTLEIEPDNDIRILSSGGVPSFQLHTQGRSAVSWERLIMSALVWLKAVRKDWIKANKLVLEEYPLRNRYGVVPHSIIRSSLPAVYRLDTELGRECTMGFVRLVEDGFFNKADNTEIQTMTAADYFRYCRIAYIASKRDDEHVDENMSGKEMYARFADGRHEGLLEIDPDSAEEFAGWIDGNHLKRTIGGHPWEIKRGGNTTHIDLSVSRPHYRKEGFMVELRAEATGRLAETVRMFMAIHEAGLPISITHPEVVRKRLLAQDNIGIVPSYASLHRANQHFSTSDDVFDVMHYDDLGRYKRRITAFITWEPLPILKPKNA